MATEESRTTADAFEPKVAANESDRDCGQMAEKDSRTTADALEPKVAATESDRDCGQMAEDCLDPSHGKAICASKIRCRRCFGYGHISRSCGAKRSPRRIFHPVRSAPSKDTAGERDKCQAHSPPTSSSPVYTFVPSPPTLENHENSHPPPPPPLPSHLAALMANFLVDPRPFVPLGFTLVPREVAREPSRLRSFLAFSLEKSNEDLAIVITEPRISKDDFWPFGRELRAFLHSHQVQDPEIQQCPMGEAYVRFDSPMQRESFVLGGKVFW
nr:unnamed protein product [Digitaria exilis]